MDAPNIESLTNFLELVRQIIDKHEEIALISGENFNVFKVLNLQTSEVRVHSAFLAELLNAKGTHGQGGSYLRHFIDQCGVKDFFDKEFDVENSEAFVERYIGSINEEKTQGGRLDILIEDINGNRIIIENKIYASDQENQLLRYYNNFNKNAKLLYLTLAGDKPSAESTGGKLSEEQYDLISYKEEIIQWLIECKQDSVDLPIIRETITQYIHLLKYLTNQAENYKMQEEITRLIIDRPELIDSIDLCAKALQNIFQKVTDKFWKSVNDELPKDKEVKLEEGVWLKAGFREDNDGIHFYYVTTDENSQERHDDADNHRYYEVLQQCTKLKIHDGEKRWIGWWIPEPFKDKVKFSDHFDRKKIADMYKNDIELESITDNLIQQEKNIRELFIKKLKVK